MALPTVQEIVKLCKTALTIEAQEKIMELRQAAMNLQDENLTLRTKIQSLEATVKELSQPSLPRCPRCGKAAFSLKKSVEDPAMGEVGLFRRLYQCNECGFSENRQEQ